MATGRHPRLGTWGLLAPTLLATQRLLTLPANYHRPPPPAGRQSISLPTLTQVGAPRPPTLQHPPPRKARLPTLEEGNNLSPKQDFLCNNLHI